MRSDTYTFIFAAAVCVTCSVILALATAILTPMQERNMAIDKKKNVLLSLDLYSTEKKLGSDEIEKVYADKVKEMVINKQGEVVEGKTFDDASKDPGLDYLFLRKDNGSIAIPVEGMGLWDIIEGYLALENNGHKVAGITFYEQKETAGLGAEIVTPSFTNSFKGKDILDKSGKLVSVTVAKGSAADAPGVNLNNAVDGISGATMTGTGVTKLLQKGVNNYKPYLEKLWKL